MTSCGEENSDVLRTRTALFPHLTHLNFADAVVSPDWVRLWPRMVPLNDVHEKVLSGGVLDASWALVWYNTIAVTVNNLLKLGFVPVRPAPGFRRAFKSGETSRHAVEVPFQKNRAVPAPGWWGALVSELLLYANSRWVRRRVPGGRHADVPVAYGEPYLRLRYDGSVLLFRAGVPFPHVMRSRSAGKFRGAVWCTCSECFPALWAEMNTFLTYPVPSAGELSEPPRVPALMLYDPSLGAGGKSLLDDGMRNGEVDGGGCADFGGVYELPSEFFSPHDSVSSFDAGEDVPVDVLVPGGMLVISVDGDRCKVPPPGVCNPYVEGDHSSEVCCVVSHRTSLFSTSVKRGTVVGVYREEWQEYFWNTVRPRWWKVRRLRLPHIPPDLCTDVEGFIYAREHPPVGGTFPATRPPGASFRVGASVASTATHTDDILTQLGVSQVSPGVRDGASLSRVKDALLVEEVRFVEELSYYTPSSVGGVPITVQEWGYTVRYPERFTSSTSKGGRKNTVTLCHNDYASRCRVDTLPHYRNITESALIQRVAHATLLHNHHMAVVGTFLTHGYTATKKLLSPDKSRTWCDGTRVECLPTIVNEFGDHDKSRECISVQFGHHSTIHWLPSYQLVAPHTEGVINAEDGTVNRGTAHLTTTPWVYSQRYRKEHPHASAGGVQIAIRYAHEKACDCVYMRGTSPFPVAGCDLITDTRWDVFTPTTPGCEMPSFPTLTPDTIQSLTHALQHNDPVVAQMLSTLTER